MKWKEFFLIMVLILVVLVVAYISFNHPFLELKKEFISYLEKKLQVTIQVKNYQLWPLNRIILKDVKIKKAGIMTLKVPEIKIYYNIFSVFCRQWFDSLKYITFKKPELSITDTFESDYNFIKLVQNISSRFSNVDLHVDKGRLLYRQQEGEIEVDNLTGAANFINGTGFDLGLQAGIDVKKISFQNYNFNDLNLESMSLQMQFSERNWEGVFKSSFFDLQQLAVVFMKNRLNKIDKDYNLEQLKGKGKLKFKFKGHDFKLQDYYGDFTFEKGEAKINIGEIIKGRKIKNAAGSLIFSSANKELVMRNLDFDFAGNPFNFNGILNYTSGEEKITGHLFSSQFDLSQPGLTFKGITDRDIKGFAQLDLNLEGKLSNPRMSVDLYLPQGEFETEVISHLKTHLRYRNGLIYVDSLNANFNQDNQIILNGVLDSENWDFSFDCKGEGIKLALINKYLDNDFLDKFEGRLNFRSLLNGRGLDLNKLNAVSKIEIIPPEFGYNKFKRLETECWLAEKKVILNQGLLAFRKGKINFEGEVDLNNNNLAIALKGKEIALGNLNKFIEAELPEMRGKVDFNGKLTNILKDPLLKLDLTVDQGGIKDYSFHDLKALISYHYNNKRLQIKKASAVSKGVSLKGSGTVGFYSLNPDFSGQLSVKDFNHSYINEFLPADNYWPVKGKLTANLAIEGSIFEPRIKGTISSANSTILTGGENYKLDSLSLDFGWNNGQLSVNNFSVVRGKQKLGAWGEIKTEIKNIKDFKFDSEDFKLNLNFVSNNINLAQTGFYQQLSGDLNLFGHISGKLLAPVITGKVEAKKLHYKQQLWGQFESQFVFKNDNLRLKKGNWSPPGDSNYQLEGEINSLFQFPSLRFSFTANDSNISDLFQLGSIDLPVNLNYNLSGEVEVKGSLSRPYVLIDLSAYNREVSGGKIKFKGEITEKLNIEVKGSGIDISRFSYLFGENINISGKTDFQGQITGSRDDMKFSCSTEITNSKINNISIENIKGEFTLDSDRVASINQTFKLSNKSSLNLNGDILLKKQPELDFNLKANRFPLQLLEVISDNIDLNGYGEGELKITGTFVKPNLNGRMVVKGKNLNLGLPEKVNFLKGIMIFSGQSIQLSSFKGKYANKLVNISGKLRPFSIDKFWDLNFRGEDILFAHGSYEGSFDPRANVEGPLYQPLISGEIQVHDFVVNMPFSWPESDQKSRFQPRFDLNLYPGEEVYLRSDHIDVAIQKGTLHLISQNKELQLEGELSSFRGNFNYYSNRFMLKNGNVVFQRYNGYIPQVHVEASTVVKGTRIIIRLDGPGDNMIVNFSSRPELSEKEILNLLTSKGGIGKIISGEDSDSAGILGKEFMRFLQETFQLGFVSDLEKHFRDIWSLDRMTINTYELGLNDEIDVNLGKNITDEFYLEYSTTLISDDEKKQEISFQYYLEDNMHIEGSWLGDNNYRLSIETTLHF